ncbi:transposase [Candidatus Microgenomates bacterium]|nr:transposase [Candidatus Microgenomates bacterium]
MVSHFQRLVRMSKLVTKKSFVNVDFSTFCGFQTLAFGVQTGKGRALPVWLNCITYPIKIVGSQNIFVLEEIKRFGKTLGFYPSFVFDRGFWIPCVMKFLLKNKIHFYLRIKRGQQLFWEKEGKKMRAKYIGDHTKDATILLFGYKMRLIISPPPPRQTNSKKPQNTQRWYILTNDFQREKDDILDIYATRFEIEELFKDYKHIQKLKTLKINKKETFVILLWFASLAFWIAWWLNGGTDDTAHPKKRRSFFRRFWESLQQEVRIVGMQRVLGGSGCG